MEKDVLITIGGMLSAGDGEDNIDMVFPGQYYWKNERHFLVYEEIMEEFTESTSNLIRFSPEEVVVRKRGVINTEMVYRPEEETLAEYSTPYGILNMMLHTDRIRITETEERITLWIDYSIHVDSERMSENYLKITVQPKSRKYAIHES